MLRRVTNRVKLPDARVCNVTISENEAAQKTLVFLPGALGSLETDFKPQFDKSSILAQKYRLVCFEPAGYGLSRPPARTWPDASFLQRDADDCAFCLNELKIEKPNIIGWSDGGITGLCLAAKYDVEKLVIWGSNATMSQKDKETYLAMRDVSAWSPRMRASFEAVYGDEFPGLWAAWVDSFITYLDQRGGDVCLTETKSVTAPTLIIHGDKDPMVSISLAREIEETLIASGNKNVVYRSLPDGKHNLHFKYADQFAEWVISFIER